MDKRILVADYPEYGISKNFERSLAAAVEAGFSVTVKNFSGLGKQETIKAAEGFPVVADICHRWPGEIIEALSGSLRLISRTGAGYDNVDLVAATAAGVAVTNCPGLSGPAVAEMALGLMLCAARRMGKLDRRMREGCFDYEIATQLTGKTAGIVGFGAIGRQMAKLLHSFSCRILIASRTRDEAAERALGATFVPLETLLRESDFVSLHCPLTPATRGMIGRDELSMMKRTAVLVNTARGAVVNEEALIEALRGGVIAAAGLDVLEKEPPRLDNPLLTMDNVVLTPHCASATPELTDRLLHCCAENIVAFGAGEPKNVVNPDYRGQRLEQGD